MDATTGPAAGPLVLSLSRVCGRRKRTEFQMTNVLFARELPDGVVSIHRTSIIHTSSVLMAQMKISIVDKA